MTTRGRRRFAVSYCLPAFLASARRVGSRLARRGISVCCSLAVLAALIVAAIFTSSAIPASVSSEPAPNEVMVLVTPAVSAGLLHTVGLRQDGSVVAVGNNYHGECNVGAWTDICQVSAGSHTLALKRDGTVLATGDNWYGQCNVNSWYGIQQVAAGDGHTVGLRSDGTVVAVGSNGSGQCNVGSWTGIQQVAAGYYHTVGLKSDGTVVTVGLNTSGQCDVSSWTGIQQVAAGSDCTLGLKADGTVVAVGNNSHGQCNVSPWTGIVQVSAGGGHTLGLKADGTVMALGEDGYGERDVSAWTGIVQLAAGLAHTVGLKPDGTVVAVGSDSYGQRNVQKWTQVEQVAAGMNHTVGLKDDGTLVAAGDHSWGECNVDTWTGIAEVAAGLFHTVGLRSDGTVKAVGKDDYGQCSVDNWTEIQQVAAGWDQTLGLKADGTVVAVGRNDYGQCNVDNWTGIQQIAAACYHAVGLKADGTVVAVGRNDYGQCNVDNWTGIQQIAAGGFRTVGLKSDGTVVAVGLNDNGQCNVGSWTGVTQVATGEAHTVGLRSDATVIVAGPSFDPAGDIVRGWTAIHQLAAGGGTTGLEQDGTVVVAGGNTDGQSNTRGWKLKNVLTVLGITADDKVYDGRTTATLNTSGATIAGVVTGDNVTLVTSGAMSNWEDKNAGSDKTVAISGLTLSGPDAAYYHLIQPTANASVTQRPLTVSAAGISKTYDGTTSASVALFDDRVSGDSLTVSYTASFADKTVASSKAIDVSGISLSGPDAGNYSLSSTTAPAAAGITQRPLTLSAKALDKMYDGSTDANVTLSDDRVPGDSLTVSCVAGFVDKSAGTNKMVNVSGISIIGADAGNYGLSSTTATTTASIAPKSLAVTGITASSKTHDGATTATINVSGADLVGGVSGDDVALVTAGATGAFGDEAVGAGKTVTISGLTLSGSDAGNYSLETCTTTADIKPSHTTNWGLIGGAAAASVAILGATGWLVIRRRSKSNIKT